MTHESAPAGARKSSSRAFNRIYFYLAAWLASAFYILFQYHSSDQSITSLIATLAGLAAVSAYCCVAVFKAFRAAILGAGRTAARSPSQ